MCSRSRHHSRKIWCQIKTRYAMIIGRLRSIPLVTLSGCSIAPGPESRRTQAWNYGYYIKAEQLHETQKASNECSDILGATIVAM